ncbi:hypothetical protein SDJN03_10996, partial [Cucurbita argyrosperma subsp. sororia]
MLIGGQEIIGDGWGAFLFCMTNRAAILVQERQPVPILQWIRWKSRVISSAEVPKSMFILYKMIVDMYYAWNVYQLSYLECIDSKRWLRRMIMLCCKEREFEADECVKAHDVCYEGPRQNFPPPLRGLQQPPAPFPCKLLLAGEISFSGDDSAPLPFTCSGGVFQVNLSS